MAIEMVDSEQEQNTTSVENGKTWVDTPTMLEIMGVSKSTLYKRIDKDEVESEKFGATRLFKVDRELVNGHQTYDFPQWGITVYFSTRKTFRPICIPFIWLK